MSQLKVKRNPTNVLLGSLEVIGGVTADKGQAEGSRGAKLTVPRESHDTG